MKNFDDHADPVGEKRAEEIADLITEKLPDDVNFALFTFTVGPGGFVHYVSTVERGDMLAAIFQFIFNQDKSMVQAAMDRAVVANQFGPEAEA